MNSHGIVMTTLSARERPVASVAAPNPPRTSEQPACRIDIQAVPDDEIYPTVHFECIRFALIASVGY